MASQTSQPHFVLIPLMAQGHMIPMIDMAKLFAERGVIVSLVTTPCNASRFDTIVHRAKESGLPLRLVQIEFSCQEVGLPIGYENLDILPSPDLRRKFYKALSLLQEPLEKHLEKQNPPPTCIISDKSLFWTSKTAQKFNIPRLVFHGMGCFSLLSSHNIKCDNAHQSVTSDSEPFLIPGLPQRIEITRAQLPGTFVPLPDIDDFRDKIQEAELAAYGVVVNSFDELENECVELYRKAINKKVWCVGPVSLCNKENLDKFERGNKAPIDAHQCSEWLNSMKPRSVIYACLGSLCRLVPSQLIELGLGLEASNQPFIWVIKTGPELEEWLLKENFEERIKGRGLLIRGWASQEFILSHPATGGFLTHCGWNSIIESMCPGLPMITWPLFSEQFLNEKLVVEILRIGIRVGVDIPVRWGDEERVGVLVKKDEVEKAIVMLMDEGEEGEKRRKKARELGDMARRAMGKGGSSQLNMSVLIEDIRRQSTQEAEQPTPNSLHVIFAFMFSVILSLLGVKHQGKANTPFDIHPITMSFGIAFFLAYCLAYGFELNCFGSWLSPTHAPQLQRSMVVFGSLSLASFVSVLFPGSVQSILFGIYVLLLMGFLLHAQVKIFWKWIKQRIVARLFRLWERNVTDQGNILPL